MLGPYIFIIYASKYRELFVITKQLIKQAVYFSDQGNSAMHFHG